MKFLYALKVLFVVLSVGAATTATNASAYAAGPVSVADLAERLLGAVVNISTSQNVKGSAPAQRAPRPKAPEGSPYQDFFDEFFKKQEDGGKNGTPRARKVQSLGSGFVIDPKGIIITNNHVIADADEITIEFADGSELKAEVIGKDAKTDIAVLKVTPPKPLKSVPFGASKKARIGDWVMAIGNPFGQGSTVTMGIISAINRDIRSGPYDNFIQTDAAINRGNSGGPLFNMDGEVIGINTAIISPTGGSIGLGFSIPSSLAIGVIEQLREFGETRRGWLGVSIQPVTDDIAESLSMKTARGALVGGITPNGPAQKSGLKVGDVILSFDKKPVAKMRDLPRIVADTPVGKAIETVVLRKGKEKTIQVTVGRLEDGEKLIAANQKKNGEAAPDAKPEKIVALGMTFDEITDENKKKYKLADSVKGVLITNVEAGSVAAEKGIRAGSVLSEIAQEAVNTPREVTQRLATLKKDGRKKALLLVSGNDGQLTFVVLSVE